MLPEVIKNMVFSNAYLFDAPRGIRCIDDRDDRQKGDSIDPLPDIAIPGAGLGLVLGVFGGLNLMDKRGMSHNISRELAYRVIYDLTGGIPYHSDEAKIDDENPAAGCGHFAFALKNPEEFLLSENDLDFLNKKCLPELALKKKDRILYCGGHSAAALVVIESRRIGLPALLTNGSRVYVYSKIHHFELIDRISFEIFEKAKEGLSIDRVSLREFFMDASNTQLKFTVNHLASSLPSFSLNLDDKDEIKVLLNK